MKACGKNPFEKDFFKLMNNSVFGTTMENLRKRIDIRPVTNEKKLLKLTSKQTYVSSKIFNENPVAAHKIKEALTLNRPAYVGMCILDLSKMLMYDFHYNYIKEKRGDRAKLLFIGMDSLTYEIETEDVYIKIFGLIKTNSTLVITQKTHHFMIRVIRKSLVHVSLKMKQLVFPQLNSLVLSPKCIHVVSSKMMKKMERKRVLKRMLSKIISSMKTIKMCY